MIALITSILLDYVPLGNAIPALETVPIDTNPLVQPFLNAILPVQAGFTSRFSLFRRQGCPNLTLLCPSGGCCSDDTSCCGSTCCPSGYLCTGGTAAAPCCGAITSPTNECGGSNGNVSFAILSLSNLHPLDNILTFWWTSALCSLSSFWLVFPCYYSMPEYLMRNQKMKLFHTSGCRMEQVYFRRFKYVSKFDDLRHFLISSKVRSIQRYSNPYSLLLFLSRLVFLLHIVVSPAVVS